MDGTDIIVFNNFFFHFVSSSPPLSLSSFSLPRSSPFSFSFFLSRRMDFHRGCCPREIANRLSSSCFQNIFQGLSSRSIAFRIRRENAINYGNGTERNDRAPLLCPRHPRRLLHRHRRIRCRRHSDSPVKHGLDLS